MRWHSVWICAGVSKMLLIVSFSNMRFGMEEDMKIAVTYEDGNVFTHFGRTEQFKIYDITGGKVADAQVVGTDGNGHGGWQGCLRDGMWIF